MFFLNAMQSQNWKNEAAWSHNRHNVINEKCDILIQQEGKSSIELAFHFIHKNIYNC